MNPQLIFTRFKLVKKVSKVVAKVAPKAKKVGSNYSARMNRIVGQIGGVKKMIEDEKTRAEILIQLKAVRSAIKALESEVLEDHLQSAAADLSVGNAAQKSKKLSELKKIFLRFD